MEVMFTFLDRTGELHSRVFQTILTVTGLQLILDHNLHQILMSQMPFEFKLIVFDLH